MSNSFFMPFKYLAFAIILILILICFFFIPTINFGNLSSSSSDGYSIFIDNSEYVWPSPGFTYITSYFGKRNSPTAGASSYHYGIDIGASQGANLIAVTSGQITFTGFLGSGGYTITLTNGSMKFTYCHVSPNYIVREGDFVVKGQVLGHVGPKNVYGVSNNPYKDSQGRPTNGATTGPHLHFGVRMDGKYINPLSLFKENQY